MSTPCMWSVRVSLERTYRQLPRAGSSGVTHTTGRPPGGAGAFSPPDTATVTATTTAAALLAFLPIPASVTGPCPSVHRLVHHPKDPVLREHLRHPNRRLVTAQGALPRRPPRSRPHC